MIRTIALRQMTMSAQTLRALRRHAGHAALLLAVTTGLSASRPEAPKQTIAAIAPAAHVKRVAHVKSVVMHKAAVAAPVIAPSAFAREAAMSDGQLMARWKADIRQASRRFAVPEIWIRAVMIIESGGRTMMGENRPITSDAGAMGLMQLMPETWQRLRRQYGLGADPYDPHDNIIAGAAYLRELYRQYDYPGLFAAYNDGPGMLEAHRRLRQMMPAETTAYVWNIASILSTGARLPPRAVPAAPEPSAVTIVVTPAIRARRADDQDDEDYP
jgi:soluble lytic murein transglycosylase-like protein